MSEAAPEEGGTPRRAKLSRRTWLISGGVAVVAGVLWYLYRSRQNSAAAPPATTADTGTSSVVDQAGELSVIQSELEALLQQQGTDAGETEGTGATGTGGGTTSTGNTALPAPGGFSITPVAGGAHVGWGTVPGATVYELLITGAGGKGTGTSHYDHTAAQTHASVSLAPGRYLGRVRAGKSSTDVHGTWTANKAFTVGKTARAPGSSPVKVGQTGEDSGGSG